MTANQIAYAKYLEESRSNRATESLKQQEVELKGQELEESIRRTNLQIESEKRAQDLNVLNVQRQTQASITSAGISAAASRYSADMNVVNTQANIEAQKDVRAAQVVESNAKAFNAYVSPILNAVGTFAGVVARFA
jgi:DNA polymerase II small subunit/DNA polymerase delta subunit B